eukprot:g22174.t1
MLRSDDDRLGLDHLDAFFLDHQDRTAQRFTQPFPEDIPCIAITSKQLRTFLSLPGVKTLKTDKVYAVPSKELLIKCMARYQTEENAAMDAYVLDYMQLQSFFANQNLAPKVYGCLREQKTKESVLWVVMEYVEPPAGQKGADVSHLQNVQEEDVEAYLEFWKKTFKVIDLDPYWCLDFIPTGKGDETIHQTLRLSNALSLLANSVGKLNRELMKGLHCFVTDMLQKPKDEEAFERCARGPCMQALYYLQNKSFNNVNRCKGYAGVKWLCPLSSSCKLFRLESNELSFTIDIVDDNTDNLPNGISKGDVEQFMSAFIRVALLDEFKSNRNVTSGRNSLWSLEDAKRSPAQDMSRPSGAERIERRSVAPRNPRRNRLTSGQYITSSVAKQLRTNQDDAHSISNTDHVSYAPSPLTFDAKARAKKLPCTPDDARGEQRAGSSTILDLRKSWPRWNVQRFQDDPLKIIERLPLSKLNIAVAFIELSLERGR